MIRLVAVPLLVSLFVLAQSGFMLLCLLMAWTRPTTSEIDAITSDEPLVAVQTATYREAMRSHHCSRRSDV